jgi:hypothetical protein
VSQPAAEEEEEEEDRPARHVVGASSFGGSADRGSGSSAGSEAILADIGPETADE